MKNKIFSYYVYILSVTVTCCFFTSVILYVTVTIFFIFAMDVIYFLTTCFNIMMSNKTQVAVSNGRLI